MDDRAPNSSRLPAVLTLWTTETKDDVKHSKEKLDPLMKGQITDGHTKLAEHRVGIGCGGLGESRKYEQIRVS